ncbi:MAG: hypothetical protein WCA51_09010 [Dehalococcoidia bacterium]
MMLGYFVPVVPRLAVAPILAAVADPIPVAAAFRLVADPIRVAAAASRPVAVPIPAAGARLRLR